MIFAIENSDMKNAIHLFEINIQFKKKTHKLDRKKIKMGEKEMREKYEKKFSSLIVTCIKLLLFRILRRE